MRFYGFGNYYLSSLQQGLQAGHVIGELFTLYDQESEQYKMTHDWAKNHKTMVLLNGGNSASLQELYSFFQKLEKEGMNLSFAKFNEDEQSLGGALTYVGIVVPEKYYEAASKFRLNGNTDIALLNEYKFKEWELELVFTLNNYRLAS